MQERGVDLATTFVPKGARVDPNDKTVASHLPFTLEQLFKFAD